MAVSHRWSAGAVLMGFACALPFGAGAQGLFPSAPRASAAQLAHGRQVYADNCNSCHGDKLNDGQFGPPLKGAPFAAHWASQSPEALLTYITGKMPPSGPGTLGSAAYADVEAFILAANGPGAAAAAERPETPGGAAPPPGQPPEHKVSVVARDAVYTGEMARRKAKLDALTPVTDAMLKDPPASEWLIWRRTYGTTAFSPLKQIDKASVGALRNAWSWSLPLSENEITPLVHDGVMFIESGNTVQALDAANGDRLWQYVRPLADDLFNGRGWRVKAMAIYGDKLYAPTADGHLVALDVRTGKLVWDAEVYTKTEGDRRGQHEGVALHLDGGPIVAKGKVVIGVSLGVENARGGDFIVALNAQTGHEDWRFYTIARPGQPGGDSWNGHPVNERFGGGVWTAGSYDPDLGLVYFGTGNTYDSKTLISPRVEKGPWNAGLYTDSTLAIDVDTGKLKWHYQHMNRDVWDLDWVFEQSLITLPVNGKPRKLVVTGGKIALFDAVDRATGEYLFSKDVGLQNIVTAVDPKTGVKTTDPAMEPEAGKSKLLCPSSSGARNWPTTAYNPVTKILYIPMIESCANYIYMPRSDEETAKGGEDIGRTSALRPNADGNFGRIEAVNLETRKVVWTRRQRAPVASSMLATAGGIVFNGSADRRFSAYDEMTGKVLWETRLNASPSSSPITYMVGKKQYVAVVTGGGGAFDAAGHGLAPEIDAPGGGTTVTVFELATVKRR